MGEPVVFGVTLANHKTKDGQTLPNDWRGKIGPMYVWLRKINYTAETHPQIQEGVRDNLNSKRGYCGVVGVKTGRSPNGKKILWAYNDSPESVCMTIERGLRAQFDALTALFAVVDATSESGTTPTGE